MKKIKIDWKKVSDYIIKTSNGLALGLFSTLIIGTIIGTIGKMFPAGEVRNLFLTLNYLLARSTGFGIGLGIALSLKQDGLRLIACAVSGFIAANFAWGINPTAITFQIGDPLVIYFVVLITTELLKLILKKKTAVDIILVPLLTLLMASIITLIIGKPVSMVTTLVGDLVNAAVTIQPFLMGIVISVLMGIALTAPISSAAIANAIKLGGIAGGASVVGCAVQMIGFAVMSRKDNNIGTVLSVGFGTSMLQFKNIVRKPIIWLPTIIVSAILGPLATVVFKIQTSPAGAGMGTSGLVGPIDTLGQMGTNITSILSVILMLFVLPAVLVWIVDVIFRKKAWIVQGDLKL